MWNESLREVCWLWVLDAYLAKGGNERKEKKEDGFSKRERE